MEQQQQQQQQIVDSFVRRYNALARAALDSEQKNNNSFAADQHIKLSGIISTFIRTHGPRLSESDVQFLRSETVARCMHALLLRSMELSGFGELALSLSATRNLNNDITNARKRLEDGRANDLENQDDETVDPRSHTDGLYEYISTDDIDVTLSDLPGYEKQHRQLMNAYYVLDSSNDSTLYGRRPQTRAGANAILHGPPGTGKTAAARAVAASLKLDFVFANSENILSAYRSETEKNLRKLYSKMRVLVKITNRNVVLLLDEVDGLVKNRRNNAGISSGDYSLLTKFLTILEPNDGHDNSGIFSIFTTNKLHNLDDAFLRRCTPIFFGKITNIESRLLLFNKILHDTVQTLPRDGDAAEIAHITKNWVPGDYNIFRSTVAKPKQLSEFLRSQNITIDQFFHEHTSADGAARNNRRIVVAMPLLSYAVIRNDMIAYKPITPDSYYEDEYSNDTEEF